MRATEEGRPTLRLRFLTLGRHNGTKSAINVHVTCSWSLFVACILYCDGEATALCSGCETEPFNGEGRGGRAAAGLYCASVCTNLPVAEVRCSDA